jgi:hypothetical protein
MASSASMASSAVTASSALTASGALTASSAVTASSASSAVTASSASSAVTASQEGFMFETMLYDELTKHFNSEFTIRREKDIKKEYGSDITAIDFEIFNNVKTKDKDIIPSKYVFIQLKWKNKASPISDINHYIKCCEDIEKKKKLNVKNVYHLYGTKVPVSGPSLQALNKLKLSENIYVSEMKICVFTIVNKILEFYGKNQIKPKIEVEDIYDDNTDYKELKKAILIELVIKRYNIKRSNLLKLKHADLVDILVSKNGGTNETSVDVIEEINDKVNPNPNSLENKGSGNKNSSEIEMKSKLCHTISQCFNIKSSENVEECIVKLDEKFMTLEYEEPEIRNENEMKSKLLKIGSELYIHLTKLRNLLDRKGFKHTGYNMGLHTEVLNNRDESLETYLYRVAALEGRRYNIKDKNNYDVVGRAVVFLLGELEGYEKDAKVTISFLEDDNREEALKIIYDAI